MCLLAYSNIPLYCVKEITCYKIIRIQHEIRTGLFQDTYEYPEVKEGTTITDSKEITIIKLGDTYVIRKGFYFSYIDIVKAYKMLIAVAFADGISEDCFELWECVIPILSPYFIGDRKDICSKSLKFIKKVEKVPELIFNREEFKNKLVEKYNTSPLEYDKFIADLCKYG